MNGEDLARKHYAEKPGWIDQGQKVDVHMLDGEEQWAYWRTRAELEGLEPPTAIPVFAKEREIAARILR
jgi:hypothetical protein